MSEMRDSMRGATLRPKERVMRYLEEQLQKLDLPSGSRLPTSRTLAAQLNVSASTVQAVFRSLAEQGLIRTEVGNGSFLLQAPPKKKKITVSSAIRIGMTFGFAEEAGKFEPWHLSIAGSTLSAASALPSPTAIIPLQFHPGGAVDAREFLETAIHQVDGIILRAMPGWEEVESRLSNPHFPIIHLNPTGPTATKNFASTNFFEAGARVGTAFLAAKRKRVIFLHVGRSELTISSQLRCGGLFSALGNSIGHTVHANVEIVAEAARDTGFQIAQKLFVSSKSAPDAIYTTSNEIAYGILDFCTSCKLKVPEDLALVAGSGIDMSEESSNTLTRERQNTRQIGMELLRLVVTRVQEAGRCQPAVYVNTRFTGGETTLPVENKVLQAAL